MILSEGESRGSQMQRPLLPYLACCCHSLPPFEACTELCGTTALNLASSKWQRQFAISFIQHEDAVNLEVPKAAS